ncbi:alpha/beta fold hydrolase [Aureimonas populi]|uniref:Alpha/beta fold hydrolase n=1 Tax=Aureimonas populi TaxID=1701758 RepID=A0ABW5CL93_9HYPH|nr:alpha/beta hydrolase [Aureimonas populi]
MDDTLPPFVEIPENPIPPGLAAARLRLRDGKWMRYALAAPANPRGTVLILQGRNEAIEKYFETIGDLMARGFAVAIFDWRGQGGSERLLRDAAKGHIDRVETYVRDLDEFVARVLLPDCRAPYVVLAHSTGGLVALQAIPRLVNRVERMVLSAPLVAFPARPRITGTLSFIASALRLVGLGRTSVRRLRPGGPVWSARTSPLSSDPRRLARNMALAEAAPQLFVHRLTASWVAACAAAMRRLDDSDVIAGLHLPTLFVTAGDDKVVNAAAAERLAWRMRSGHVLSIPGARHELLQEADIHREQFLAAFEGFVGSVMPVRAAVPDTAVAELEQALSA